MRIANRSRAVHMPPMTASRRIAKKAPCPLDYCIERGRSKKGAPDDEVAWHPIALRYLALHAHGATM